MVKTPGLAVKLPVNKDWVWCFIAGSELGKEITKAVYCYPAYLTYMQCVVVVLVNKSNLSHFLSSLGPLPLVVLVVHSLSLVWLFATPQLACSMPGLSVHHHLLKFAQDHVHCISDVIQPSLILWCPLLLLPSIFSHITDFSNESAVHSTWPKFCNFSFSISPSSGYSGLISLRIDWFDLLAVQGTADSLLQHHSSKALILWCSAFLMDHLSQSHMTTRKIIALTIRTFVGRVMSLLALDWAHAMSTTSIPHEKLLSCLIVSLIPQIMWDLTAPASAYQEACITCTSNPRWSVMDKNQEIFSKWNSGDFPLQNCHFTNEKSENQRDLNKFV